MKHIPLFRIFNGDFKPNPYIKSNRFQTIFLIYSVPNILAARGILEIVTFDTISLTQILRHKLTLKPVSLRQRPVFYRFLKKYIQAKQLQNQTCIAHTTGYLIPMGHRDCRNLRGQCQL